MSDQALESLYERVTTWQRKTFPNQTAASILAHMWKELAEIAAAPHDVEERADMAILAMGVFDRRNILTGIGRDAGHVWKWGGAHHVDPLIAVRAHVMAIEEMLGISLRHVLCGFTSGIPSLNSEDAFLAAISAKMDKNEARRWPAPSEQVPGHPVEHVREPYEAERRFRRPGQFDAFLPTSSALVLLRDIPPGTVVRGPDTISIRDLIAERTEWRANNDRLREERQRVREILGARPNEGVIEAARRVMVRPVDTNPGAALAPGEEAPQ